MYGGMGGGYGGYGGYNRYGGMGMGMGMGMGGEDQKGFLVNSMITLESFGYLINSLC